MTARASQYRPYVVQDVENAAAAAGFESKPRQRDAVGVYAHPATGDVVHVRMTRNNRVLSASINRVEIERKRSFDSIREMVVEFFRSYDAPTATSVTHEVVYTRLADVPGRLIVTDETGDLWQRFHVDGQWDWYFLNAGHGGGWTLFDPVEHSGDPDAVIEFANTEFGPFYGHVVTAPKVTSIAVPLADDPMNQWRDRVDAAVDASPWARPITWPETIDAEPEPTHETRTVQLTREQFTQLATGGALMLRSDDTTATVRRASERSDTEQRALPAPRESENHDG